MTVEKLIKKYRDILRNLEENADSSNIGDTYPYEIDTKEQVEKEEIEKIKNYRRIILINSKNEKTRIRKTKS